MHKWTWGLLYITEDQLHFKLTYSLELFQRKDITIALTIDKVLQLQLQQTTYALQF